MNQTDNRIYTDDGSIMVSSMSGASSEEDPAISIELRYRDGSAEVGLNLDLGAIMRLQEHLAYATRMLLGNPGRIKHEGPRGTVSIQMGSIDDTYNAKGWTRDNPGPRVVPY